MLSIYLAAGNGLVSESTVWKHRLTWPIPGIKSSTEQPSLILSHRRFSFSLRSGMDLESVYSGQVPLAGSRLKNTFGTGLKTGTSPVWPDKHSTVSTGSSAIWFMTGYSLLAFPETVEVNFGMLAPWFPLHFKVVPIFTRDRPNVGIEPSHSKSSQPLLYPFEYESKFLG